MIPEAAVEAAARGMLANSNWGDQWDDLSGLYKDWWRATATSALEAAAPHMLAEAWEEGKNVRRCDGVPPNPYR